MKVEKVGVIGHGFVGSSISFGLSPVIPVLVYDKDPLKSVNSMEEEVKQSDVIFVSVPTPMNKNGSINLNIVNNLTLVSDNEIVSPNIFNIPLKNILPSATLCVSLTNLIFPINVAYSTPCWNTFVWNIVWNVRLGAILSVSVIDLNLPRSLFSANDMPTVSPMTFPSVLILSLK